MDAELKELLKKNLGASEESLKILKKIHKDILWRRIFGLVKFVIVVAIFIWSYWQLEPILQNLLKTYQGIDPNSLPPEIRGLIEGLLKKN